jgi:uncharacterized membrane protein YphA (DoxX/SURF4 family)
MNRQNFLFYSTLILSSLFLYSGLNKVIYSNEFHKSLEQNSFFDSGFTNLILIITPYFELLIAVGLLLSISRKIFLWISFVTLLIFTFYLIFINTIASLSECGCGGLFSQLSFEYHLIFNLSFIIFNAVCILFERK